MKYQLFLLFFMAAIQAEKHSNGSSTQRVAIESVRGVFQIGNQVYMQNSAAKPDIGDSFSFLLSLASFLSSKANLLPEKVLSPFSHPSPPKQKVIDDSRRDPSEYFGVWCDVLFDLLGKNSLIQYQKEVAMIIPVSRQYASKLIDNPLFTMHSHPSDQTTKEFLSDFLFHTAFNQQASGLGTKIAIINFSTSSLNTNPLKPKIELAGLLSGICFKQGDQWTMFKIISGDIPSASQLQEYDLIVLSGSTLSILDRNPQVQHFSKNLMKVLNKNRKLKILAICYGHHLISNLFGSAIKKGPMIKRNQLITFIPENMTKTNVFRKYNQTTHLTLYQFHQDYVTDTPKGFIRLGKSSDCSNEMLVSEDNRILTTQFHPQYTEAYVSDYEEKLQRYNKRSSIHKAKHGSISKQQILESLKIIRQIIREFIDM